MFSWILCCILLSINLLLLCWVHSLHSGMEEIGSQFDRRLRENTNNLIYVSSRDPHIRRLAAQLCLLGPGFFRADSEQYTDERRQIQRRRSVYMSASPRADRLFQHCPGSHPGHGRAPV